MKKTAIILLLLVYGSATMGTSTYVHYCMNEYVGWSLFQNADDKCGKCGMEEADKGGCCKDEHNHFKLKTDHNKADIAQFINFSFTPALIETDICFSSPSSLFLYENFPTTHGPPDTCREKLHILNSVFLI